MGAFCVYGVSRSLCKAQAEKKVSVRHDKELGRAPTIQEWAARVAVMTEQLFIDSDKRVKISPEFDAPQFCRDWIAADPTHIKQALIMARAEKTDKNGERVIKAGAPVMTWVEYVEPKVGLF